MWVRKADSPGQARKRMAAAGSPGQAAGKRVGQAAHRQAVAGKPALWADDKPVVQAADKPAEGREQVDKLPGELVQADTAHKQAVRVLPGDQERAGVGWVEPELAVRSGPVVPAGPAERTVQAGPAEPAARPEAQLRNSHRIYQCCRLLRN